MAQTQSEVVDERTGAPPGRKPPRFGLGADGTSSPAGLIVKIVMLGLVAAIAVWAAFPLIDRRTGSDWRSWSPSPR